MTPPVDAAVSLSALSPLVGKWHTEGEMLEGPLGPAARFVAVEVFQWLEGGHFLVHRLDGHFGDSPAACVEVLGMRVQGDLGAQTYYGDGRRNEWVISAQGQTLVWSGKWPPDAADPFHERYTMSFEDAGNTLVGQWEQSKDGQSWTLFLSTRSTKAQPLPSSSIGT